MIESIRLKFGSHKVLHLYRSPCIKPSTIGVKPKYYVLCSASISSSQNSEPARNDSGSVAKQSVIGLLPKVAGTITSLFPLWVSLAAITGILQPSAFTWLPSQYITIGLAFVMLGMGLTLTVSDFTKVVTRAPHLLLLGLVIQYTVMPGLGFMFSRFAGLPPALATGMIVVSCCPGGTASNIVAYIAKCEMGLSIMMTTASTLAAVIATPLLTSWLVGTLMPVNPVALLASTAQVVLLPVVTGCALNMAFPAVVSRIATLTPALATLVVSCVVGSTLAQSAGAVRSCGLQLVAAVASLHSLGFLAGYLLSWSLRLSPRICRTNSIEAGMQNATLGAVLATLHFGSDPLVAAPCAVSSCVQCFLGAALAAYWSRTVKDEVDT